MGSLLDCVCVHMQGERFINTHHNISNIILHISRQGVDHMPAVLLVAHHDSPVASPGVHMWGCWCVACGRVTNGGTAAPLSLYLFSTTSNYKTVPRHQRVSCPAPVPPSVMCCHVLGASCCRCW